MLHALVRGSLLFACLPTTSQTVVESDTDVDTDTDADRDACGGSCTLGRFDACTCGADDPCSWSDDGVCDVAGCESFIPNFWGDYEDCPRPDGQGVILPGSWEGGDDAPAVRSVPTTSFTAQSPLVLGDATLLLEYDWNASAFDPDLHLVVPAMNPNGAPACDVTVTGFVLKDAEGNTLESIWGTTMYAPQMIAIGTVLDFQTVCLDAHGGTGRMVASFYGMDRATYDAIASIEVGYSDVLAFAYTPVKNIEATSWSIGGEGDLQIQLTNTGSVPAGLRMDGTAALGLEGSEVAAVFPTFEPTSLTVLQPGQSTVATVRSEDVRRAAAFDSLEVWVAFD